MLQAGAFRPRAALATTRAEPAILSCTKLQQQEAAGITACDAVPRLDGEEKVSTGRLLWSFYRFERTIAPGIEQAKETKSSPDMPLLRV